MAPMTDPRSTPSRRPRAPLFAATLALLACGLAQPVAAQGLGAMRLHDVQGRGHRSPFHGRSVSVVGVITSANGSLATLQSLPGEADADPATSEAVFVQLVAGDAAKPGDLVRVTGKVDEFNAGGDPNHLTSTRIEADAPLVVIGRRELPPPVVLGEGGRPVPTGAIDDDSRGHLDRHAGAFDPENDALDFFESLEAMRVAVPRALAVGATSRYGELVVLADDGAGSDSLAGAALVIDAGDFNPERIMLRGGRFDQGTFAVPLVPAGTRFAGSFVGVMSYDYGNPKLLLTQPAPAPTLPEFADPRAPAAPAGAFRIASYNVENLSARSDAAKVAALGRHVVKVLGSPDLLALQEIQDDSGPADDGVTSGQATLAALVEAIDAAGGPSYQAFELAPEDGADGGQPGGNIRVAFLVRSDGALQPVWRAGGAADVAVAGVAGEGGAPALSQSPGRVGVGDPAWRSSRVPLALELRLGSRPLFVVSCHLRSKGGDTPLFGAVQPPELGSETQRLEQATEVGRFVGALTERDPAALVVVLGDFNDFAFSAPLRRLVERGGLVNLTERLPPLERWSYIYQGNAQALDHVLVSPGLLALAGSLDYRVLHVNAPVVDGASDHDPVVLTVVPKPGDAAR